MVSVHDSTRVREVGQHRLVRWVAPHKEDTFGGGGSDEQTSKERKRKRLEDDEKAQCRPTPAINVEAQQHCPSRKVNG